MHADNQPTEESAVVSQNQCVSIEQEIGLADQKCKLQKLVEELVKLHNERVFIDAASEDLKNKKLTLVEAFKGYDSRNDNDTIAGKMFVDIINALAFQTDKSPENVQLAGNVLDWAAKNNQLRLQRILINQVPELMKVTSTNNTESKSDESNDTFDYDTGNISSIRNPCNNRTKEEDSQRDEKQLKENETSDISSDKTPTETRQQNKRDAEWPFKAPCLTPPVAEGLKFLDMLTNCVRDTPFMGKQEEIPDDLGEDIKERLFRLKTAVLYMEGVKYQLKKAFSDDVIKEGRIRVHGLRLNMYEALCLYNLSSQERQPITTKLLSWAAFMDICPLAKKLLEEYPESKVAINEYYHTPLHISTLFNNPEMIGILVAHGLKVEARNGSGHTSLQMAAILGRIEAFKVLLQNGADATIKYSSQNLSLLHLAAEEFFYDVVKAYLQREGLLEKFPLPLHHTKIIEELVKAGFDIDEPTEKGLTPLHIAAKYGSVKSALVLIDLGANINAQDKDGKSPLHYSAMYNKEEFMKVLLKNKPEIDLNDRKGRTVLHVAALNGFSDIVNILVKAGANILAKDNRGIMPCELTKNYYIRNILAVPKYARSTVFM